MAITKTLSSDIITADQLRESLNYDPETGIFTWQAPLSNRVAVGDVAGNRNYQGYTVIQVRGRRYLAHRLAVLYMTGAHPPAEVDHKDLDRSNTRFANLRLATRSQNSANRYAQKNKSLCKLKGVDEREDAFIARISVNKQFIYLGSFRTAIAAHAAYCSAAKLYFGDFARGECAS